MALGITQRDFEFVWPPRTISHNKAVFNSFGCCWIRLPETLLTPVKFPYDFRFVQSMQDVIEKHWKAGNRYDWNNEPFSKKPNNLPLVYHQPSSSLVSHPVQMNKWNKRSQFKRRLTRQSEGAKFLLANSRFYTAIHKNFKLDGVLTKIFTPGVKVNQTCVFMNTHTKKGISRNTRWRQ